MKMCKFKRDSFVYNQNLKSLLKITTRTLKTQQNSNNKKTSKYLFEKIISNFFFGKGTPYGQNFFRKIPKSWAVYTLR